MVDCPERALSTEDAMPSRRCPHCRVVSSYDKGGEANLFGYGTNIRIRFDRCTDDQCQSFVAVVFDKPTGEEVEIFPPLNVGPDELLPDEVKIAFREALGSLNEGLWNACVLMCRRALEEATRILGEEIEPEDERSKYNKKVLYRRIEHLAKEHRITPDLRDWAHEARLGGKLGAHGGTEKQWNTQQDAEEIVEFATWFFRYVFILPQQLAERRGRVTQHADEDAEEAPEPAPEEQR